MRKRDQPYTLTRRGRIFYVRFRLPDGNWSTAKSTGEHTRAGAIRWAVDYLGSGPVISKEGLTLAEFSQGFFDWSGPWATDKRASGKRVSPRHCKERQNLLAFRILPVLGATRLNDIDRGTIKDFRNALFNEGLSGTTINKALSILKTILESAEEHSLIRHMPRIDRAAQNQKHRGILTIEEMRRLFAVPWKSYRDYVCNRVAACTGLRRGELLALTLADLRGDYINVSKSWDEQTKTMNITTKTGRSRIVIVPSKVRQEIEALAGRNPWKKPESFLFFSSFEHKPIDGKWPMKSFYRAMNEIGISEEERARRNITFHSHRHFVNSILVNARVPLQRVQALTGHLTDEMTQRYYHVEDDLSDIRAIQERIFD